VVAALLVVVWPVMRNRNLLLDVLCRSTCFGRLHAHHQEITTALTTFGFTLECGGSSVVSRGLAGNEESEIPHNQPDLD